MSSHPTTIDGRARVRANSARPRNAVRPARLAVKSSSAIGSPFLCAQGSSRLRRSYGSLRRECLDHIIILGERHLSTVLAEFVAYYNHDRPHRTLGLETPVSSVRSLSGEVRSRPILGGLHHAYERAA